MANYIKTTTGEVWETINNNLVPYVYESYAVVGDVVRDGNRYIEVSYRDILTKH